MTGAHIQDEDKPSRSPFLETYKKPVNSHKKADSWIKRVADEMVARRGMPPGEAMKLARDMYNTRFTGRAGKAWQAARRKNVEP